MDSTTAARLIELNRDFYTRFGDSFSATRHRIQPGVRRVLEMLNVVGPEVFYNPIHFSPPSPIDGIRRPVGAVSGKGCANNC